MMTAQQVRLPAAWRETIDRRSDRASQLGGHHLAICCGHTSVEGSFSTRFVPHAFAPALLQLPSVEPVERVVTDRTGKVGGYGGSNLPLLSLLPDAEERILHDLFSLFVRASHPSGYDPRMNVVTIAYLAVLRDVGEIVAGTDAGEEIDVVIQRDGERIGHFTESECEGKL